MHHRRHPTHHTVKHLPDVGWSQNLDLPPSAARPALPRGEITWFPPPRSACSRPFLAVFIQNLKKTVPAKRLRPHCRGSAAAPQGGSHSLWAPGGGRSPTLGSRRQHLAGLRRGRRRCGRPPAAWRGFGPFRRKNGRRQCPRPGPTVTKLGRTAVVLPTPWPTKFRGREVWGGYSSGRHHGSIGGCGQ